MVAVDPPFRSLSAALAALLVLAPGARADWAAPHALAPAPGRTMQQVLVDRDGRALALWSGAYEGASLWQAAAGPSAPRFGRARRLLRLGRSDLFPAARTTSAGRAVVVYEHRNGPDDARVAARVQRPDGSWTAAATLSSPHAIARSPILAMDARGDALAAWRTKAGTVEIARRPAGTLRFQRPDRVAHSTDGDADFGALAVALGPQGQAVLAFVAHGGLHLATGTVRSGLGAPRRIGPAALPAEIGAADGPGGPLVAWTSGGACRASGAPGALAGLAPGALPIAPAVAVAPDGTRVVACPGDGPLQVFTAPPGQPFATTPERLGDDAGPEPATLAAGPGGEVAAAWSDSAPAAGGVQVAVRPAGGGPFGAPQLLAGSGLDALGPLVALGPRGRGVVAWTDGHARAALSAPAAP